MESEGTRATAARGVAAAGRPDVASPPGRRLRDARIAEDPGRRRGRGLRRRGPQDGNRAPRSPAVGRRHHRVRGWHLRLLLLPDPLLGGGPRHRHGRRDVQGASGKRLLHQQEWLRARAHPGCPGPGGSVHGAGLAVGRPGGRNREARGLRVALTMKEERTMASNPTRYSVGGVLLSRPFKIRRLGHFGFNAVKMPEGLDFYGRLLGFRHSDILDFGKMPWAPKGGDLGDTRGYFMRYGTDHHAFVLFNKRVLDHRPDRKFAPEVTVNQITWQCGSLREIMDAHTYFQERGVPIQRVGRDMPGSNWHVYVYDPDGHTIELYYGIEQIGWNQLSKPTEMYYRGFREKPSLPQVSEITEVAEALDKGIDVLGGNRTRETLAETFDVEGVLRPRPFKITKIGPVGLFVADVARAEAFYVEHLGFVKSEETTYRGARCVFLRPGADRHSVVP